MLLLEVVHVGEAEARQHQLMGIVADPGRHLREVCRIDFKEQGPPQKGQFKKDDNNQRNGK